MTSEIVKEFCKMQNTINDLVQRIDNYANSRIDKITPYKVTKTAYIDDTEITFTDVPAGNMTIYTDKVIDYQISRESGYVTISFSPLEDITKITLSILKEE